MKTMKNISLLAAISMLVCTAGCSDRRLDTLSEGHKARYNDRKTDIYV